MLAVVVIPSHVEQAVEVLVADTTDLVLHLWRRVGSLGIEENVTVRASSPPSTPSPPNSTTRRSPSASSRSPPASTPGSVACSTRSTSTPCTELAAASQLPAADHDARELDLRRRLKECETKLSRYRDVLERGTDAPIIGDWIAEVEMERRSLERQLGRKRTERPSPNQK